MRTPPLPIIFAPAVFLLAVNGLLLEGRFFEAYDLSYMFYRANIFRTACSGLAFTAVFVTLK